MNTCRLSASTRPGMRKANYVACVKLMLSPLYAKVLFIPFKTGLMLCNNRDKGVDRWCDIDIIHFTLWWCRIWYCQKLNENG